MAHFLHIYAGKDKRSFRSNSGVALIETAIVLLLLVLMTFGIMEYGWMFMRMSQISNAAQAGARQAVLPDANFASVEQTVQNMMDAWGMAGYALEVDPPNIGELPTGQMISVRVEIPYVNAQLMGLPILPTPNTLSATISMSKEGP